MSLFTIASRVKNDVTSSQEFQSLFPDFRSLKLLVFLALLCNSTIVSSQAIYLNENFNSNPVLSPSDINGAWYPDRYRPAAFESFDLNGQNVLKLGIDGADGAQLRPSAFSSAFYNTQGRKFNQSGLNSKLVKAKLFIPADWATKKRRSDIWATAQNSSNAVSYYPILGFANTTGSNPTFRYWNGSDWTNAPYAIAYDEWYDLEIEIGGNDLIYRINSDVIATLDANGSVSWKDIIIQAYNFNDNTLGTSYDASPDHTYDAYWDDIITTGPIFNETSQTYHSGIQSAINASMAGDKIAIPSGTYTENINSSGKEVILAPGDSPGCVTIDGSMTLDSDDELEIELDGNIPCEQYDRFEISGTVNLGSANLNLVLGYEPAVSDVITIITSGNPVVGKFAQGDEVSATFGLNTYNFQISYSSNIVQLTPCTGTIVNNNTMATYCSLDAAIAAAQDNDVIYVPAGVYTRTGTLTINKPITLIGAQEDVDPRPYVWTGRVPGSASETIIEGPANTILVNITSGGVVINGFHFRQVAGAGNADLITSPVSPVKSDLDIKYNIISGATDEGVQIRGFNNATLQYNYVLNTVGDGLNFADNASSVNLKINDNEIVNSASEHGAIFIYTVQNVEILRNIIRDCNNGIRLARTNSGTQVNNVLIQHNEISGEFSAGNSVAGIRVQGPGTHSVQVLNNTITAGMDPKTVFSCIQVYNNVSGIAINDNYMESGKPILMRFAFDDNTGGPTVQVDATCNWFGTSDLNAVNARTAGNGNRIVSPYLLGDSDVSSAAGFVPGDECGSWIYNETKDTYHSTFADAISYASSNDIINAIAATFTEDITVDKKLFINGANAAVPAGYNMDTRDDESVINGGFRITSAAAGTEIKGFNIKNGRVYGSFKMGVAVEANDVVLENNIIEDISTPAQSDGITTTPGVGNLSLVNNTIQNNWRGMYLNPGNGHIVSGNDFNSNNGVGVAIGTDGQSNITFSGNSIINHNVEGIGASAVGANFIVENNILEDNVTSVAHYGGQPIIASCNWWGTTVLSEVASMVSGNVTFLNYLNNDDIDTPSCDGSGPVTIEGEMGISYTTIQGAINASSAGDKIKIASGTYTENISTTGKEVTLAPGASPGCVQIIGTMTLDSNDDLEIEIDGATVCTQYDQFDVSGTVNLGGANLDLVLGYAPALGAEFEIIISDVPIIGQFAQGASISATYMSVNYVFSISYSGNKVTLTACSGGVINVQTTKEFCSIQAAIDDNATMAGQTIEIASGTYDEQVLVNKGVTLKGVGMPQPEITFTGTPTGKPAIFDISFDGVRIENLFFNVNLATLKSAIIASGTSIDQIEIIGNTITGFGTPVSGNYTDRNAVSVNFSGNTNYRIASGGVDNIVFQNNTINGTLPAGFFRAGISADEAGGTFSGNTIQSINQDIQVRFGGNGDVSISNNILNGGGVEISDFNAGANNINITSNTFNSLFSNAAVTPRTAVLRLKNNYHNKLTLVSGNTFTDALWSISSENYRNVSIDNNIFSPPAASTDYLHIGINTKSISSNSNAIVQVPVDGVITNNVFNGSGTLGGTAIGFFNHDSDNASFGTFSIGTAGNENEFGNLIGQYIRLDNQTGSTDPATIPTDYPNGGGWLTTMACWNQDYDIRNNLFNVGSGLQATSAMNAAQRTTLENRLFHKPDAACTGNLTYFDPVTNITQSLTYQTIAAAITAANPGDVIELKEWTFNEKVVINKSLTIQGVDKFNVILDGTGLGNARGIEILNGITNVTIQNLTVQNYSGNSPNSFAGIYAVGGNNGLNIQNVNVFDNIGGSGIYANGPVDNVTINQATISGHTAVAGAARGVVIWNGHKSNISITNCVISDNNCCGIELQDGTSSGVNISNNTLENNGDNGIGIIGMTYGDGVNIIENNTITNCGRFGIEIKNPDGSGLETGDGAILVQGNTVARDIPISDLRDIAAIAVMRRGVLAGNVDVPSGVVIKNNDIFGYLQPSTSEGFGIVVEGSNHTIDGNFIQRCNVGFQIQAGNIGYPGDSDQSNLPDQYFGRANSPVTCQVTDAGQTYGVGGFFGNGTNFRIVGMPDFANDNARGVLNTNTSRTYCTIQRAIDNVLTVNTHNLEIKDAAYHENVIVNKQLSLTGVGTNKPRLTSPGPNNFIMRVERPDVTIQNLHFRINQGSTLRGLITTASGTFNNLSVLDNYFEGTGTTGSTVFGSFAMELGSFGGVNSDHITIINNEVEHTGTSTFGRALRFWNAHGSVANNEFTAWYTIQGGDPAGGNMSFTGNTFNGVLEFNNGQANRAYDITGNTFGVSNGYGPGSDFAHIEIKNNSQTNSLINIENNTFSGHSHFSIFSGRSAGVTVQNNTFTPDANATAFTHIHVNTKHRTGSFPSLAFSSSISLLENTFNGNAAPGQNGKAIELANHDNVCNFGSVVFGTNAQKNIFQNNLAHFIRLNDETGTTTGHPIWGSLQASTMAKVSQDFNITENTFDAGAGQQMPSAMDFTALNILESKLYHKPDDIQLGQLLYYLPVTNLTTNVKYLTIQSAIDDATAGDIIDCDEWIFNERVNINKTITLQGSGNNTIIEGIGTPGTGHAIGIPNGIQNVTIKDLRIQNFSGVGGIAALQNNSGLEINNVTLNNITPGGVAQGAIYVNGSGGINNIDILNNTITNTGAGRAIVIWNGFKQNVNISGNTVTNNTGCCGIELQDGTASGVTITNNVITNMGDNGIGVVGLKAGAGPNLISGNNITDCGRFGIEVKLPYGTGLDSGDGSIVVEDNIITQSAPFSTLRPSELRDLGGIVVIRRGFVVSENNEDIPQGVIVRDNTVSGFVQDNGLSVSEGFGIVVEGISHQVLNNTVNNNDVGVQVQAGHTPYAANTNSDGNQNNVADQYFGRGNSPVSCDISIGTNNFSGNGADERLVGVVANDLEKLVTNMDANRRFCSINAAVASTFTTNGHVITASAATYPETVLLNKSLTLRGSNHLISPNTGSRISETIITGGITVDNAQSKSIVIEGFQFDAVTSPLSYNGGAPLTILLEAIFRRNIIQNGSGQLAVFADGPTNSVEATIVDNRFINMTSNAAQVATSTGQIELEFAQNYVNGTVNAGLNADGITNSTIVENTILNTQQQGIQLAGNAGNVSIANNVISNANLSDAADRGGIRLYGTNFTGPVTVNNNAITTSNNGIAIRNGENITGKDITVENNSLLVNPGKFAIYHGGTGTLNATCNWYGTTDYIAIDALTSGNIVDVPYLTSGVDDEPLTIGFQPEALACGGAALVTNITKNTYFSNIKDAIQDAGTTDGDTLVVLAGTYSEFTTNTIITKSLVILGPNAGKCYDDPTRGPEAVISLTGTGEWQLNGTGLFEIDGFYFDVNKTSGNAIFANRESEIRNTIFNGNGAVPSGTTYRAALLNNALNPGNRIFECNQVIGFSLGLLLDGNNAGISVVNNDISYNTVNGVQTGSSLSGGAIITGNTIIGNANYGINMANAANTIQNNTITGGNVGLRFFAVTATQYNNIINNTFRDQVSAGIYIYTNLTPVPAINIGNVVSGNTFTNIPTYVDNTIPDFRLDISNNTFDGILASSMSLSQLFSLEDKVSHIVDLSKPATFAGYLRLKNNEVFVTQNSNSISRAAIAADAGDIIHVQAGTFEETVSLDKSLDIRGAQYGNGIPGRTFMGADESIVESAAGQNAFTTPPGGANDVSIRGFSITSAGGAGGGINMNGVVNNLIVRENILAGFTDRLAFSPAAGSSNVTFEENEVYDAYAGAYFPNGASGTITRNYIHDLTNGSLDRGAAVVLEGSNPNVSVSNNFLVDNGKGVYIHSQADAGGADNLNGTAISDNDLSGNTMAIANNRSVSLNAECNWYGANNYNTIQSLTDGLVDNIPFLTSGTDADAILYGFQTNPLDCNGTPVEITNAVPAHVICGETVGSIEVTFAGGDGPYTISWTGGGPVNATSPHTINGLVPGIYTITMTDAYMTTSTATAEVLYLPVTNVTNTTYHATIQAAIDAATAGNTISVCAGTFIEDVVVNKTLILNGAGIGLTNVVGPIGGEGATIRVAAPNVQITGFSITRVGNNPTDWNNGGLNFAGVAVQGQTVNMILRDSRIWGNRTAVDINNSNNNQILNCIVEDNHTGLFFRNQTDNTVVEENFIQNNRTVGILFIDASSGSNSPVQSAANSSFNNNSITGNWYAQVVDRQTGGSLPAPGANLKNFECNWFGVDPPVLSNANSAELGYAALLPVMFGGVATAPGGQPDIAGPASANIKFQPYLTDGTDDEPGTIGFQPVPGNCQGCLVGGVINTNTSEFYCSIQEAINDVTTLNGHTLQVLAGTYAENIEVTKELTILGPNAAISPNGGTRVAEAIILPATSDIYYGEIFQIKANNVTISGLTIDGDNPALTSGYLGTNGADLDAAEAITVYSDNRSNLNVSKNIIKNLSYFGVTLYGASFSAPATSGHVVDDNLFQDMGTYDEDSDIAFWGGAVLLYNNQYAQVSNNSGTNLRIGVQTGNFAQANPGAAQFQRIENNTFSTRRLGIFHNLAYSAASEYTLADNNFTAIDNANEVNWDGITLASLSVPSTTTNNTIDAVGTTKNSKGIQVWNVNVATPAVISGGSLSNVNTGVFLNNFEGYNSDATFGAHASITGISINPNAAGTGIRLLDSPSSTSHANVQLTIGAGVTVTGGTKGLIVENDAATLIAANNIAFSGTSGNYIELIANDGNIDATAATFDGLTGATATLAENYDIEDKILHGTDNAALGFVRVKADEVFVTPLSASIQRGVNVASSGDQVNVKEGEYPGLVSITGKTVHLKGANRTVDGNGIRVAESKIVPAVTSFGSVLLTIASGAHGTTVDGFEINGNNPLVTSGLVVDGEDIDATYGVFVSGVNDVLLENNIIKNLGSTDPSPVGVGIYLYADNPATSGAIVRRNLIQNIDQSAASATLIGIISAWNAYSQVYDNTIRKVRTGIQTGNAHFANPGTAARIENNDIESTRIGIWHNLTYNLASAYTIKGNKVKAVVGNSTVPHLLNYDGIRVQSFTSNHTPAFILENEVDGNAAVIQAAKPSMEVQGLWMENLPTAGGISITDNYVKNVTRGVYAAADAGNFAISNTLFENSRTGLRILGGSSVFSGNSFQGIVGDSLMNHTGAGNVTLNCNWWGTTILEDIENKIFNTGSGNYILGQLLTVGDDQDVVKTGFQPDLSSCILTCPDPILMASTMDICEGEEITFTGSGSGVDEFLFYLDVNLNGTYDGGDVVLQARSGDDTFVSTSITHGQVIGIVGYKNITECPVNSATINITVRTRPVHADSLHLAICSEDEKTFIWNDHLTNAIASTYTWTAFYPMGLTGGAANGSGPDLTTTLVNVTPNPLDAIYTVTPIGTNLCSGAPFTVTLPVNPEPVTFNANETHCSGSPLNLDLTDYVMNDVDISAWQWTLTTSSIFVEGLPVNGTASTIASSFVENLSLSPRTVVYTVTPAESLAGCVAQQFTITLVINPVPQAVANPNGPLSICDNEARVLNGNAFGGQAPYHYQWSIVGSTGGVGGAISVPSAQSPTLTTSGTGPGTLTIRLVVTDNRGCSSTDEIVFQVGSSPVLNTIIGDNTVCATSTELYQVTDNPGSTYAWNVLSGGVVVSANNSFAADVQWVAAGGPFVVQLTETNAIGCSKVNTLSVMVSPLPTATSMSPIPMATVGNPATITINGLADGSYNIYYVLGSDAPTFAVATSVLGIATFQTRNLIATDEGATVTVNLIRNNTTLCEKAFSFSRTISFMLEVVEVDIQVMLSGPYNNVTHQMGNALNTLGYLPLSQPYNTAPFNYAGSETLASIPGTMVDWVIVRLRNKLNPALIVATKAGVLHQNGTVTATDGVSPLEFLVISDDYYIEVNHRNHLGAMSATAVPLSMGTLTFDFTSDATYGLHAQREFASNRALWSGDSNGDGQVIFAGGANDLTPMILTIITDPLNSGFTLSHVTVGYYHSDIDMNGQVVYSGGGNDQTPILLGIIFHPGNTMFLSTYIIYEQLP